MPNTSVHLFPRKDCNSRSQKIHVACGEFVMVEGYGLPKGICIEFNKIDEDPCKCEYSEKPFCVGGSQVGLGGSCTTALLTMPGCYVAYMCGPSDNFGEDFRVRAEKIKCLDNLAVTFQGIALGA